LITGTSFAASSVDCDGQLFGSRDNGVGFGDGGIGLKYRTPIPPPRFSPFAPRVPPSRSHHFKWMTCCESVGSGVRWRCEGFVAPRGDTFEKDSYLPIRNHAGGHRFDRDGLFRGVTAPRRRREFHGE
jgi:hypothetical protein